ncbi:trypsin-like peptidase domain-containing protein [Flavobacterium sp.]|jgi:S1-C subfamily serine protease/antitoxin component YwqK of YwqJK toxin-antitoxin module|uniref:trypsin-like peptidase domain-containing protein n=1 Tax=Flavobacterium sp. TaxID=239 RepID=UPI0037BE7D7A
MKKILLLFLVLCINIGLFSQSKDTIYYNSKWELANSSNNSYYLIKEGNRKNGAYTTYYITGEIRSNFYCNEINYEDILKSKFDSEYKEYSNNGKTIIQGNYVNGLKDGKWNYFSESGNLTSEEVYEKGILNGMYARYYDNNKLYEKGNMTNGKKNGDWVSKYYDGALKSIYNYKDSLVTPICHICNEYKKCKAVINNPFNKNSIQSDWTCNDTLAYTQIDEGLLVTFNKETKSNFYIDLQVPWKEYDDISFEVTFKNTENSALEYGLVWNENLIENTYNQFMATNESEFIIYNLEDNVYLGNKIEKTESLQLKPGEENILKVTTKGNQVYYSINGDLVDTQKITNFEGSLFKIIVYNNENLDDESIILKNFIFKDTEEYSSVENGLEPGKFEWTGSGSGFYVSNEGYIVTNYHVVENANEVWIKCKQDGIYQKFKAEIIQKDVSNDLALIKITDSAFKTLKEIPYSILSGTSPLGSNVFTLGYPLAYVIGENVKYTSGNISSNCGMYNDITSYQMTVPVQPGNSGGPLFDTNGNIVGVVVAQLNKELYGSENVNYAIKSNIVKNIVDMVPNLTLKKRNTKMNKLTQVEKINLLSDYVVMIQTF